MGLQLRVTDRKSESIEIWTNTLLVLFFFIGRNKKNIEYHES